MIQLPDPAKSFEYENDFYLSCDSTRIAKVLAHYELFKMTNGLPGAIVECGVFKGVSLVRLAHFRDLFGNAFGKKIIGFDVFGEFPATGFKDDHTFREKFVKAAGAQSIGEEQLWEVLKAKRIERNIDLVKGDVCQTVPAYVKKNPHLRISLLNLDVDIYEPSVVILEQLWDRIVPGGVLVLDDYGTFPGETKAVDEFFKGKAKIQKFPFCMTPSYIVKE
ncbi:MAG: TylF/MycF/NovP-related O-methyltransferase [Nanoarchaeota archaeon]